MSVGMGLENSEDEFSNFMKVIFNWLVKKKG